MILMEVFVTPVLQIYIASSVFSQALNNIPTLIFKNYV